MPSLVVLAAAATLVLPAFEVSVEPENKNFDTRFTITNVSGAPQRARINVWTDRGHAVLYYTTQLGARASKTISVRDLIVDGSADICASPGQRVPEIMRRTVVCQLTTGCRPPAMHDAELECPQPVGGRHAHAIGYVTVDSVADCMDLSAANSEAYLAQIRPEPVFEGVYEQIANGSRVTSGSLIDRAGAPPVFQPPSYPEDPLAVAPPERCPPLSEVPVEPRVHRPPTPI